MYRSLKLIAYLEQDLNEKERLLIEEELKNDPALREELRKLEELYFHIDEEPEIAAPETLRDDFNALLDAAKKKQSGRKQWLLWSGRAAAAIALLIAGIWIGKFSNQGKVENNELAMLREEVKANRALILQSLQEPSASQRFIGVNASNKINMPDKQVIDALVKLMNSDDNTNVRVAAVRALARFSNDAHIRKSLLNAVVSQSDPLVQVVLIDVLVETGDKRLVPTLEGFIKSDTIMETVKEEAQWAIMKLS